MNIISFTNAGKRRYGDDHWFWAVWVGVEQSPDVNSADERRFRPYTTWNHVQPTASGFCPSRKESRRAVWDAIKSLILDKQDHRAYERSWARQMLWERRETERRPYFSRCKIGPDKWLWVAYSADDFWDDRTLLARGLAASAESAHDEAVRAVGQVENLGNTIAEGLRTKEAAIKRSQRSSNTTGAAPLEFAYECHDYCSDYDGSSHDSITAHRIVKRTKKRIYVEREEYREDRVVSGDWQDFIESTFILDRAEFEQSGKAKRSRHGWWNNNIYYSDPAIYHAEQREMGPRPDCLAGLGLPARATVVEIQSAYRKLARQTHPDSGGNAEAFKRVNTWYEQAMASVQGGLA